MGIYKYVTLRDLRDEGISEVDMPDDVAVRKIERASKIVNELTEQWFVPVARELAIDGNGGSLLMSPVHVLKIYSLVVDSAKTRTGGIARVGVVEPAAIYGLPSELPTFDDRFAYSGGSSPDYLIDGRQIRSLALFPGGIGNVVVQGVFGWLEDRIFFETKTVEDLVSGATEVELEDASGIRPGQVLAFFSGVSSLRRTEFVTHVDSVSGNTVTFVDPANDLGATLPAETAVGVYGEIPEAIRQATLLLVNRSRAGIAAPYSEEEFFSRLKSEKTDNYQYTLATRVEVTGDDFVNQLLSRYVKPTYVGSV